MTEWASRSSGGDFRRLDERERDAIITITGEIGRGHVYARLEMEQRSHTSL